MNMRYHEHETSWTWDIMNMRHHEHETSWTWDIMNMRHHEHEISWTWDIMNMRHHEHETSWTWDIIHYIMNMRHHTLHHEHATSYITSWTCDIIHYIMDMRHHTLHHEHETSFLIHSSRASRSAAELTVHPVCELIPLHRDSTGRFKIRHCSDDQMLSRDNRWPRLLRTPTAVTEHQL